ncbi:hypothetical protein CEN44_01840 [Fischerella muscicola CCMEE 5323]|uniref:DUF1822 domain-containing protein n=1 Tax=Fischerella muscicola CCMEE 5323 TaxID=2019572 RepID=A0A2N6K8I0_FISMU|nr:DUF1822 family protein [Fischerella muscicola]PLZ93905.1 hypothetical protein CEN44_01840 [Fischerella muscicola CCMEE 5323]
MSHQTYNLNDIALTLPITQATRTTAQQFAHQLPYPQIAERVRLNTLCILAVNDYLQMMGIPTDLEASDSWNPIMRLCADVADLELPGIGRLECRPVLLDQQIGYVPPETWEERVGYVFVQVDESLQEAKLLGFLPSVATEEIPLTQLQPLEDLIEHLAPTFTLPVPELVNLSQWFTGIFEAGWQTIESLWNQPEIAPAFAFRSGNLLEDETNNQQETVVRRGKLIDLGIQIANQFVMLVVEISPQADQQTSVLVQLYPANNQNYLTPGVQLTVLDKSGAVFLEAQARSADNYIQLKFRGEPKEEFTVQVALYDACVKEHFVI